MTILKGLEKRARLLRQMAITANLEGEAKALFEEVCCGSRPLWPLESGALKQRGELRSEFYRLAHDGMWSAQERFVKRIESGEPFAPGEEALYRMAMDAIAWQMIERQLCYARRLYREKKQPILSNSNLQSVVGASRYMRKQKPDSMPLISDLTTFVQIGDILAVDPDSGFSIIEVKEGTRNHEIGELAQFYRQSGCENFKQVVSETETAHTVKQFERMLRQMERMDFAANVLSQGKGHDPDLKKEVHIPEPYIPMEGWDEQLNKVLDAALDRGWAIDVIDECLFIGAYASPQMRAASPFAFLTWLDSFTGGEFSPIARLTDSLIVPLALPIFATHIPPDRMMDLMFGRLHVCMGISLTGLVEECNKHGIAVRPPNKAERRAISQSANGTIKYKGQPMVLERNGKSMVLADGIFVRALFHCQRPISVIKAFLDN